MKSVRSLFLAVLGVAIASAAFASFGGGSKPSPPPPTSSGDNESSTSAQSSQRQEAEKWYGDAYNDVQKGKESEQKNKANDAEKHYKRALDRGQHAVELDSMYHEAWNLIGFTSRKLKNYDGSIAAYQRCLRIKPDFAPAREYLGEAYLEMGRIDDAKKQLAMLDPLEAPEEARTLNTAIQSYETAHPSATASASSSDSTKAR
ncbi:MAG TPA: tetratricopeptide repeat protein [Candidatus Sulfotelmatobacter sp.]|nr:tetratricopeptide repeat protein [Candidatus Sulfotelmatobacter sp.]